MLPTSILRRVSEPGFSSPSAIPRAIAPVAAAQVPASLNLPVAAPVVVVPVVWPQVKYLGLISQAKGTNQVALLAIDNQELIIKLGASSHGLKLVKVFRDSVQLTLSNQRKSFYRNGESK